MVGTAVGRYGGRLSWLKGSVGLAVLLTALPPYRLVSQVGHDPARSPFRDVRSGGAFVFGAGYLTGERGKAEVGLSNGLTWSVRYEQPLGDAMAIVFGAAYAQTSRFVVDPLLDSLTRKSGQFDNEVILADVGFQLRLTGAKSWHGVRPYVGGSLGFAFEGASPPDTSKYEFGTKLTLSPGAGIQWHPGRVRRLSMRADFRAVFWRLRYPESFRTPSPVDGSRVLPVNAPLKEWTAHPWVGVGVGWTF